MDCIIQNHLIYSKIYENIDIISIYNLWNDEYFCQSITDYLRHLNIPSIWRQFKKLNLNSDFIACFNEYLKIPCKICKKINKSGGRFIPYYKNSKIITEKFLCNDCDIECCILDCRECYGKKIQGIFKCQIEKCETYAKFHFVCECKNPCFSNICESCDRTHFDIFNTNFFCMKHLSFNFLNYCNFSIVCVSCKDKQ